METVSNHSTYYNMSDIGKGPQLFSSSIVAALNLTLQCLFTALGVSLNIITIMIVCKRRHFGKRMRIQLTNLAIADLLSSLLLPVSTFIGYSTSSPETYVVALQKTYIYLWSAIFYAGFLCHVAMLMERLLGIYFLIPMLDYTRTHVIRVTVAIWILSFLVHIYTIIISDTLRNCLLCSHNLRRFEVNAVIFAAMKYFIPATIILVGYLLILAKLRQRGLIGEEHKYNVRLRHYRVCIK